MQTTQSKSDLEEEIRIIDEEIDKYEKTLDPQIKVYSSQLFRAWVELQSEYMGRFKCGIYEAKYKGGVKNGDTNTKRNKWGTS